MVLLNMSVFRSVFYRNSFKSICRCVHSANETSVPKEDEEFRILDLRNQAAKVPPKVEKYVKPAVQPPRELSMPTDQVWSNVWPGPRTYHPAAVPLPLRQGFYKKKLPPGKYANTELMKLANFLHLTPPAVKKHCDVLKQFCTPWPEALTTDEDCWKHFPLEITTTDYCHSSPRIRDPKARVVTFKFYLSRFSLDKHAEDKIKRLLRERYDDGTGLVTLVTDRCPLRKQNYDYNTYLILALFYESWKVEDWEAFKEEDDMEYYDWERNTSKYAYMVFKQWPIPLGDVDFKTVSLDDDEIAQKYKAAVTEYLNNVEDDDRLLKYKEAVKQYVFNSQ